MKDSIYFSHDADARSDEKIISLIMAHGYEGYGIYWAIVEMLRTATEYRMQLDCKRIAFALHMDSSDEKIESIINDFNLFECKTILHKKMFFSKSLNRRMKLKEDISEKRRNAAMARWNGDANALQMHSKSNAIGMQLECNKEKKGKKERKESIKENTPKPPTGADLAFDAFWAAYPNKVAKATARKAFEKARKSGLPDSVTLVAIIDAQKAHRAKLKASGAFTPEPANPATWLNGGRWMDAIPESDTVDEKPWEKYDLELKYGLRQKDDQD